MLRKSYKTKGFSLVEMVIYLGILAFMTVVLITALTLSMKMYRHARITRDFSEQGMLAMERITRSVRSATSVNGASSTFNTSPGVLSLTYASGTPSTRLFDVSSNQLRLTEDGSVSGNIIGGRIQVSSLIFRSISTGSIPAIKTELTLYDTISGRSETFYATTILRSSY